MVLISIAVYHASVPGMLVFLMFLLFWVQIPGLLITELCRVRFEHASEKFLISFFSGWALTVAVYFLSDLLSMFPLMYVPGPLMSALYIFMLLSGRAEHPLNVNIRFSKIPAAFCAAVVILMAYVFLNTQFLYISPDHCSSVYPSIDKTYQAGLIASLSHGYPLRCPWVHGVIEHYHIFTQIFLAVPVALFGLTPDFMVMSCSPYLTVYLVSLSLYSMFIHFCRYRNRAGLYTLFFILSNMFIARTPTSSYLFRILFINDNYGGYSAACLIAAVIMIDLYFSSSDRPAGTRALHILLSAALVMLLAGIKAPLALVLAGGVTGTYILGLILRRTGFIESTAITAASVLGFAAVFMLLIGTDSTSGLGSDSVISFGKMTGICFWKQPLIDTLTSLGVPSQLRLLAILLVFFTFFFTAFALPFAVAYLREFILVVSRQKEYSFAMVTIYASALVGFVLMMFLNYEGHSQIYFGTAASVFAPLIAIRFIEEHADMTSRLMKGLCSLSKAWLIAVLVITSVTLAIDIKDMVPSAVSHADPNASYDPYKSLSHDEYEAMQWIKKNTPQDALFATQMYASINKDEYNYEIRWNNCHFLYATYSDRFFYLEGSGFSLENNETAIRREMIKNTDRLYDPDDTGRGDLARSLGIDYVIVTKKIYPPTDLSSEDYSMVYSNNDIDIYQVSAAV